MGTSRSDPLDGLRIPETATEAEAAAVAAAIGTYLANERTVNGDDDRDRAWTGRRWAFAGRLASLGFDTARVPDGAPESGWSAAGRTDRF